MLEEKLDLLTKEIVALRKAVEENTAAGGATAGAGSSSGDDKPAGKKRGRPPKEEVTPEHDASEVEEIVRRVSREVGKPAAVKIIKSFKCDDLADLLTHPEHFDAAYEAAEAALPSEEEAGEDDDI